MKKSKLYAWGRSLLLDAKLRGKLLVIFFLLLVLEVLSGAVLGRVGSALRAETCAA